MKYENRGNDIIKIENGVEYVMVACKVNGMDSFVWEEIKPEVKSLTCVSQPDEERDIFTRYTALMKSFVKLLASGGLSLTLSSVTRAKSASAPCVKLVSKKRTRQSSTSHK